MTPTRTSIQRSNGYSTASDEVAVRNSLLPADPHAGLLTFASAHGFDGVSHFLFPTGDMLPASEHWTTAGDAWCDEYRRCGHHLADPRVWGTKRQLGPLLWDANSTADIAAPQQFRQAAKRYGIRSGVAISFRDECAGRSVICLDSSDDRPLSERVAQINGALGDFILCAALFLDCMRPTAFPELAPPSPRLTSRERQCLMLAANGMTSADIGVKLDIVARTANFHFSNIAAKFGALNRAEAVARAIAQGVIPTPRPMDGRRI